ncbi:beta-galactosidase [Streptomyces europaeiscabiei]|uniref:beta-galactosidase n=2 Tax=Streptomyces europaeiscabiei TaxID=146819 RepID=UPI0007660BD2|nr:beta-galactosidase [Streptomyces europaeiscabiei]MDX2528671.1 beta-galactosidase [Streptomyces europaeiscabiei]MDX2765733.1 beta-galactosidase [Streptomyces europaeiscabiei]MDX3712885.1 beta-galactosidase [Streptomyces europaeiscabiei]MDX3846345.1 beta-galactosidase [Streptomyces europaeiscabiei]MDX3865591.1 beta-galactosidase [Streptomyces europaeiscabiei]
MPDLSHATRGRVLFGGDYNPEQWPEEVWHEDVRLMKEAGVNTVTLGVFSWAKLEPRPGTREFGWLDTLMDLMHAAGIGVVLATPTSSPPPWMGRLHPETLPRDENGQIEWWGSRQHFSHSSDTYRRYAAAITEDLAARYGGHPALTMWHINNEYCTYDWGDEAAATFRDWLRRKYGTLGALNEAWGTAFWSQGYDGWHEILPPRRAHYMKNPTHVLDFKRFTSDMLLECYVIERDIVRRHTPHLPVTTNFMPMWAGQDAWRWAEEEDVVSVDIYPDPRDPFGAQNGALIQDMTRSQAGGGPWMLMEQAAGPVNWRGVNHPKPRGLNRLWSLQAVARGADAVCYFQWRQSRQGAEKFHSGMVSHAGEQGRTYQEVKQLGSELAAIGREVAGHHVDADVAVLFDWNSWWAGAQDGRLSSEVDLAQVVRSWHRALWESNLTTAFAHPEHDLSSYRLVVVPQLYLLTDAAVENLLAYVRGGGTLVSGFLTGVADEDDRVRPGGMDARLRDLFGIRTLHEWWPLDAGEEVECEGLWGVFRGTLWSEEIEAADADEVVPYKGGELDGLPAVVRRGRAWYVSTLPEPAELRALLARVAADAGVRPVLDGLPGGVEAVRRGDVLFLLNHGRDAVTVDVPGTHRDLLTETTVTGTLSLGRYGVAVLRS